MAPTAGTPEKVDGIERQIVSPEEWQRARSEMTEAEKEHMRAGDQLAAARRRMPWQRVEKRYSFEGASGTTDLLGLFNGRKQLITYHFMFGPKVGGWPDAGCVGCSMFADQIGDLSHLHARDAELALVSAAPLENLNRYKQRMGWQIPWFSGTEEFNRDLDVADDLGNSFGVNVFYRHGNEIYRTHFMTNRGVEALGTLWSLLDILPLGRQETWQDAPAGTPQNEMFTWWKRHDEYDASVPAAQCCRK